jgi:hypothetical protein
MGNLLRRYWIPACLSAEIAEPDGPPARVRLLGEDLVAFRDSDGRVGLIEEQCPHRGASLFYGRKGLARGEEPPVLAGAGDFRAIRGAEKILADGEDWRVLGTDEDPTVREALALREG